MVYFDPLKENWIYFYLRK